MFLVKREEKKNGKSVGFEKCRLMSFKTNPWLEYGEKVPDDADEDIYEQSVFIFSGDIGVIPTHDSHDNVIEQNEANHLIYCQRFNNDKI